jgi:hypothetical protein
MVRHVRLFLAVGFSLPAFLLAAVPALAQATAEDDCACRPFWQLVAAAALGAFLAVAIMLMLTRWRRLLDRQSDG